MFGVFVWYLGYGYIVTVVTLLVHVLMAEKKGFRSLKFWADDNNIEMLKVIVKGDFDYQEDKLKLIIECIIGFVVWPYKMIWMIEELFPTLYLLYDEKT